ncbi:hypothetical protein ACI48D_25715 [Massilia sp. LXY-6]|uniref:hypothetical protein n=1 Tax=Massilia sp. LXY-6 TaxID=3379823 RepID=UPI003EDFF8A9
MDWEHEALAERILELARSESQPRTRDVAAAGALRAVLTSMTEYSRLLKPGRSLHALADRSALVCDSFSEVAARGQPGMQYLLSVLRYESGRLARMHWTAHCSTSHLIQADDLP